MYLSKEKKAALFETHSPNKNSKNTGATECQIALFTYRIAHLTAHLKHHKKDNVTKRSLLNLVGKRKRLLNYLKHKDIDQYRAILKQLNIRK